MPERAGGSAIRDEIEAGLIEMFRKALMVEHHDDWDMETCAEAAHICARAWCDRFYGTDLTGSALTRAFTSDDAP